MALKRRCLNGIVFIFTLFLFLTLMTCPAFSQDSDGDTIPDTLDNCPTDYNPNQDDSYPPRGNDCGDVCECEGNFDGDQDVDGTDGVIFQADFGRTDCTTSTPCNGDFDCDGDVDDNDQSVFVDDFGRFDCPPCVTSPWCAYDQDTDGDGIPDDQDNCPNHPNGPELGSCLYGTIGETCITIEECGTSGFCGMNQEDNYPPGGNGIGDACECEGDFDRNGSVDADDVSKFIEDFGRNPFNNPCP